MSINCVQLDKSIHVPYLGKAIDRTVSDKFYPGIRFEETSNGVSICFKGKAFLIPWTMIQCVIYAE